MFVPLALGNIVEYGERRPAQKSSSLGFQADDHLLLLRFYDNLGAHVVVKTMLLFSQKLFCHRVYSVYKILKKGHYTPMEIVSSIVQWICIPIASICRHKKIKCRYMGISWALSRMHLEFAIQSLSPSLSLFPQHVNHIYTCIKLNRLKIIFSICSVIYKATNREIEKENIF